MKVHTTLAKLSFAFSIFWLSLSPTANAKPYSAEISRTELGVPHIRASSYRNMGFGYGYVRAEDNLCAVADQLLTLRGERSRLLGESDSNIASDIYARLVQKDHRLKRMLSRPEPYGPSLRARETVQGFAKGYNWYLHTQKKRVDHRCRSKPWLRPVTTLAMWSLIYHSGTSDQFADDIVQAHPPGRTAAKKFKVRKSHFVNENRNGLNSNVVALGAKATTTGTGMIFDNSHDRWEGPYRPSVVHLTIPNELDVFGTSFGIPAVLQGFNKNLAFSATTNEVRDYAFFSLKLVPGKPTKYLVDGKVHTMEEVPIVVPAKNHSSIKHTVYKSIYGYIVENNRLPWTATTAYAVKKINTENLRALDQTLSDNRAANVKELHASHTYWQGQDKYNVLATDRSGTTSYDAPHGVTNISPEVLTKCITSPFAAATLKTADIAILDGSSSQCNLSKDDDALDRGAIGPSHIPHLTNDTYVANSNDTHWLTNPATPLEGYSQFFSDGDVDDIYTGRKQREKSPLSLRTRLALTLIQQRITGSDELPGKLFSYNDLQRVFFGNQNYSAELARDTVVKQCQSTGSLQLNKTTRVNLLPACQILARWDKKANLQSRGAVLWRVFWNKIPKVTLSGDIPFLKKPFQTDNPIETPSDFDATAPLIMQTLAKTLRLFQQRHIPLDISVAAAQRIRKGKKLIPISGCSYEEGCLNTIDPYDFDPGQAIRWQTENPFGTNIVYFTSISPQGVRCRFFLGSSESSNPASPHFQDGTAAYAKNRLLTARFLESEIRRSPVLRVKKLTAS